MTDEHGAMRDVNICYKKNTTKLRFGASGAERLIARVEHALSIPSSSDVGYSVAAAVDGRGQRLAHRQHAGRERRVVGHRLAQLICVLHALLGGEAAAIRLQVVGRKPWKWKINCPLLANKGFLFTDGQFVSKFQSALTEKYWQTMIC